MNTDVDLTSVIAGYRLIEQLYCGSRTLVYRAIRETNKKVNFSQTFRLI
ncbi:hypothetical protein [Argonema galeatum]|nr:hypothetical protein [Argonema galeatum]MCL1465133.1 hypothetical protein [Argonema galeatum A003/A1]